LICNLLSFYFEILDNSPVTWKEAKIIINLLEKIEENQEEIKKKQIKLESEVSDLRKLMEKNEIDEIYEKEFIKVNNI
jgi:LAS superfamily LD-carboxypeptidase LdcB